MEENPMTKQMMEQNPMMKMIMSNPAMMKMVFSNSLFTLRQGYHKNGQGNAKEWWCRPREFTELNG